MNLYLVHQDENKSYDTFDAFIVAAPDEETARLTYPMRHDLYTVRLDAGRKVWQLNYSGVADDWEDARPGVGAWAYSPDAVTVRCIGVAAEDVQAGIVLASFMAG